MNLIHGAWLLGTNPTTAELETANAVMRELERLGGHSADVVARCMHAYGMQGVKGDTSECILARWLRKTSSGRLLSVGRYHVTGYRSVPRRAPVEVWRIDNPPTAHTEFVHRFDEGAWLELTIEPKQKHHT